MNLASEFEVPIVLRIPPQNAVVSSIFERRNEGAGQRAQYLLVVGGEAVLAPTAMTALVFVQKLKHGNDPAVFGGQWPGEQVARAAARSAVDVSREPRIRVRIEKVRRFRRAAQPTPQRLARRSKRISFSSLPWPAKNHISSRSESYRNTVARSAPA